MTMTAMGGSFRLWGLDNQINGSTANAVFDTSTDVLSVIFQIPKTGTIDNVHSRIVSVTSPIMTHRCELRTVDATTGKPSAAGTLYGSSTSITKLASGYSANSFQTWAVACTGATAGDLAALVFDLSAFTSGSFSMLNRLGGAPRNNVGVYPYQMTNTAASDVLAALQFNCWALEYASSLYYPINGADVIASTSIANSTVTNSGVTRRGNRGSFDLPYRVVGMWITGDLDGDCFLRMRKQSDDSILGTVTFDKDVRGTTSTGEYDLMFDAAATAAITAGTEYYFLVEGNSATTDSIANLTTAAAAQLGMLKGGATCFGTSYNAGYTDVTTQRYAIGPIVDAVDISAGGGSGGSQRVYGG